MWLTPSQRAALDHVTAYARGRKDEARRTIEHVLRMSNVLPTRFEAALSAIKSHARVALHFHPDRLDGRMTSVADGLLASGVYKSQFETRISNGSPTAFPGGARHAWESTMFGGAYDADGASLADRPKYGALDLMRHADGPSPRFGSCYFLLDPALLPRCTFTYLDSHQDPDAKGTYDELDDVLAALLVDAFTRDFALGEHGLRPADVLARLWDVLPDPFVDPRGRPPGRSLDHYVEAQVHGPVSLARDVDILVADPSFQGTPTGDVLVQLCQRYGIALYWHGGFELAAGDVPSDFRGPAMPSLARRIASDGTIDAHKIGRAAAEVRCEPERWRDRGAPDEVLQELKLLWHVLVRYGVSSSATRRGSRPATASRQP